MSISQRILKEDRTHKNGVRLVLLALAGSIDGGNSCPSVAEIADMAQITPDSARNALTQLEADKTITVNRQAGKSSKGGRTNCYSIPAYQDASCGEASKPDASEQPTMEKHPPEIDQAGAKQEGVFDQAPENPEGGNSPGSSPEIVPAEYTGEDAAGAGKDKELLKELLKELEKELKESVVISQNNSLKSLDTNAPAPNSDIPAQNADDIKQDFQATSTEGQASALEAMARRGIPTAGLTDDPEPPVPLPPLPQSVLDDYFKKFAFDATDYEKAAMQRVIKACGVEFLRDKIAVAKLTDGDHKRIENPARYIETTLERESAKQKSVPDGYVPGQYDQYFNRDAEPEIEFEPSPPVDDNWQRTGYLVEARSRELYRTYFQSCEFGGIADGIVQVYAPNQQCLKDCQIKMNWRGAFVNDCKSIWGQEITAVRFSLKEVPDAHPAPG